MYENVFTYSFLLSFVFGLFFLLFQIFFSINFSENNRLKKIFNFHEYQPILFFLNIFFIHIIFNIIILFNYQFLKETFFFFFLVQLIFFFKNFKRIKKKLNFKYKIDQKIIFLLLFFLFLISILPLSDADSISIYQFLPTTILFEGLENINLQQNLEFTLLSNSEILLLISPILKSDNFGSQLNIIALVFFIFLNLKKHKNFSLIVLSCPLIIYFISAQKLQLFFAIIFFFLLIIINKNFFKKKSDFFIFVLLLTFYSSGRFLIYYSPYLCLYIFFMKILKIEKYFFIFYNFIYNCLQYINYKYQYFGNIFAPFLMLY